MDQIEIPEVLTELSVEDLNALAASAREQITAAVALDAPTADDLATAEVLGDGVDRIVAELTAREAAAQDILDRAAALRTRFSSDEAEAEDEPAAEDDEDAPEDEPEAEEKVEASVKPKTVATLSKKVARPVAPPRTEKPISIVAAANVPDYTPGQELAMGDVGDALVAKMRTFSVPSGDGSFENLQHHGVAKFKMEFPDELTVKGASEEESMKVLNYAAQESRLDGESLVAAGGWCAPSETLYDLCVTETMDGILSVPEVNVTRGGIKFTKGIDFSTIYAGVGFLQTEAQAIAGTTKACYEVTCPTFTDVRLDAIGLCIKAPILTNAAYPEVVQRVLSGSMVAHAHKVNASVIGRMVTSAGAALAITDFSSAVQNGFSALELVANQLRQKYKLALDSTVEVVLPYWFKSALRDDLGFRTYDVDTADSAITSLFAERHLNVQWVYDWQEPTWPNAVLQGYPATVNALVYPAGTFVKGTSDVITLNAVYDAASLAVNTFTALFFEQGLLVANLCMNAVQVTIPVCRSGRTGIANVSVCGTGTEA